jgi:hypothetical protein
MHGFGRKFVHLRECYLGSQFGLFFWSRNSSAFFSKKTFATISISAKGGRPEIIVPNGTSRKNRCAAVYCEGLGRA